MQMYGVRDIALVVLGAYAIGAAFRNWPLYWRKTRNPEVMPRWLSRVLVGCVGAAILIAAFVDWHDKGAFWGR